MLGENAVRSRARRRDDRGGLGRDSRGASAATDTAAIAKADETTCRTGITAAATDGLRENAIGIGTRGRDQPRISHADIAAIAAG